MGQEAIIYGRIEGVVWRIDRPRLLQDRNAATLDLLPVTDEWPCLVRGMFAVPAPWPQGTYRQQVIHFGASLADGTDVGPRWVEKFEGLLRRLYWLTAVVHLETEAGPSPAWRWEPTDAALARLGRDDPPPVDEWTRTGTLPT